MKLPGAYFICADIVGRGRVFWAEDLEHAQSTVRVIGGNPAHIVEEPWVSSRLEEMYA